MESSLTQEMEGQIKVISIEDVANHLIKERFILTSLEFHTELVESGREIPQLRDYFSNPANFELFSKQFPSEASQNTLGLYRSSSQTTLDSFDWTRYSEDGEWLVDDRIAVLEFELRKAKETIIALRANLTQVTCLSDQINMEEEDNTFSSKSSSLRPHQVRTLNFLINEYLLLRGYKMTAITFADENDNQDFENWDDVGLNIPRPPSLPDWMLSKIQIFDPVLVKIEVSTQTDEEVQNGSKSQELKKEVSEFEKLNGKPKIELDAIQQQYTSPLIIPLSTLYSESKCEVLEEVNFTEEEMIPDFEEMSIIEDSEATAIGHAEEISNLISYDIIPENNVQSIEDFIDTQISSVAVPSFIEDSQSENFIDQSNFDSEDERKTNSATKTDTEDIVNLPLKDKVVDHYSGSSSSLIEDYSTTEPIEPPMDLLKCSRLPPLGASSEERRPIGDLANWECVSAQRSEARALLRASSKRYCCNYLEEQLIDVCFGSFGNIDSHLQEDIVSLGLGQGDLLTLVVDSLLNIAPNVILSKREELLPLLIYTISEHSNGSEREKLLHLLFNLTKRPDANQRRTILLGLVGIARVFGPNRLEAELLPQCWEQLTHKHSERRLLVAQSVAVLAPYTPYSLRNSLLLSMLQQVLGPNGEKDMAVRDAALSSLALLVGYLDDSQKLGPLTETMILCLENGELSTLEENALNSSSSNMPSVLLFYSSLALWSLEIDSFEKFISAQLVRLNHLSNEIQKESIDINKMPHSEQLTKSYLALLYGLEFCSTYIVSYIVKSAPNAEKHVVNEKCAPSVVNVLLIQEVSQILSRTKDDIEVSFKNLQRCITTSSVDDWPQLHFIVCKFLPELINPLMYIDPSFKMIINVYVRLLSKLCCVFEKIRSEFISPLFLQLLNVDENELDSIKDGRTCLTKSPLVIYCVSILDRSNSLQEFLSRQISLVSVCGASTYAIEVTICLLLDSSQEENRRRSVEEIVLGSLWSCVVHQNPFVRSTSGRLWNLLIGRVDESELASRVVPALVTLATDTNVIVKAGAVKPLSNIVAFSTNKQVCAKALLQLETLCEEVFISSLESPTAISISIANVCSELGHNVPQHLLYQTFLPCLCNFTLSSKRNTKDETAFGTALLEAFAALSSCSTMPDHVAANYIIPPLNYLEKTLGILSQEHMESITLLTKEYTFRSSQFTKSPEKCRSNSIIGGGSIGIGNLGAGQNISHQMEDVKNKMSKMFAASKAATGSAQAKSITLPGFFKKK